MQHRFISKPEAYLFTLSWLHKANQRSPSPLIVNAIDQLKIAFENHEQKPEKIIDLLRQILPCLDDMTQDSLNILIETIKQSDYTQSPQAKFENPIARRAESELFIELLLHPTKAMMTAVQAVSQQIVLELEQLKSDNRKSYIYIFISLLIQHNHHNIACGAYLEEPNMEGIIKLLLENDPRHLHRIMFIHFIFARYIFRNVPIHYTPVRPPIGSTRDLIQSFWDSDVLSFFKDGISDTSQLGQSCRSLICDTSISESPLYLMENGHRGRLGKIGSHYTNQFGLMLTTQTEYDTGLPTDSSTWAPDCKNQDPNLISQYVIDSNDNDTVYVSGPSGMTALLLGQMEILANPDDITLKQKYLCAIAAYIVGAGFHSLHEILSPAEYSLNLVPGYYIRPPQKDNLAEAPNYYVFFSQQNNLDPEFNQKRQAAWDRCIHFFDQIYLPHHHQLAMLSTQLNPMKSKNTIPDNVVSDHKKIMLFGLKTEKKSSNKFPAESNQGLITDIKCC